MCILDRSPRKIDSRRLIIGGCATMKIVFVGSGNLATHLCKAVHAVGHDVLQVYSRTDEAAKVLANIVGSTYTNDIDNITDNADIYIVAVKDNAVADVTERLRQRVGEKLIVHTAGSMSIDIIPGENKGVLYPMQTFSKQKDVDFTTIPCFIESSSSEGLEALKGLAESVSDRVYEMSSRDRVFLHLTAVFCCNFANRCYSIGAELLKAHGDIPFDVMLPLINETAKKLRVLSPHEAQTGPAVRWDTDVIKKHSELLADTPLTQQIYDLMSRSIHEDKL